MDDTLEETEELVNPLEITGRYYWNCLMTLTDRDLTKVENVLKLPLPICFNFLAEAKDIYEKQKRELEQIKNRNR